MFPNMTFILFGFVFAFLAEGLKIIASIPGIRKPKNNNTKDQNLPICFDLPNNSAKPYNKEL